MIIIIVSLIYTCYTAGYSQAGEGERDFRHVFFNGGIVTVCPGAAVLVKGAGRGEASALEDRGAWGDLEHRWVGKAHRLPGELWTRIEESMMPGLTTYAFFINFLIYEVRLLH